MEKKENIKCDNPECKGNGVVTRVLRLITIPSNQNQAHLYFMKHLVCEKCAEYMCGADGSDFEFENEPNNSIESVLKVREAEKLKTGRIE